MEQYLAWKDLLRAGQATGWQEFYVKFYQAFIDGSRWKQYLSGVGTTLMVTAMALANGQVDCVIIDSAPAEAFVEANPGLTILDTEYTSEDYAIGMNKDNTALLEAVNGALKELTEDGTIPAIVEKYIPAK